MNLNVKLSIVSKDLSIVPKQLPLWITTVVVKAFTGTSCIKTIEMARKVNIDKI